MLYFYENFRQGFMAAPDAAGGREKQKQALLLAPQSGKPVLKGGHKRQDLATELT